MNNKNISLFFMLSIIVLSTLLSACSNISEKPISGSLDPLAICLTEKGATMYGTQWCTHCQAQKKMFGNSFQYIIFVDCDKNSVECSKAGVEGYPTWSINGTNYPGEQSVDKLALLSGCSKK